MIQPIKQFRVTRLTISGFKGYADQKTFQFGGMNVISGHMGVGKSSIADAIAFAITGVGFYAGAKIDYLYHQDKLRMNRVSITLYDVVKSTGEVKDVFRFTYEGRDYICLSHSERIRAGLEVAELIKRLLGVEYPTFIDDVESVPVIDNVRPTGQVFIAKVIKGTALQVQVADNTGVPKAA